MKQLPCKRKRCIIYPTCINKTSIRCDDLYKYYEDIKEDDTTTRYAITKNGFNQLSAHGLWIKYVRKYFPNLLYLTPENMKTFQKPNPYKYTKSRI